MHGGLLLQRFLLEVSTSAWHIDAVVTQQEESISSSLGAARKTSLFFTPREIPSQSRLLVIGLVLHE
jgi:hypothetical protein